MTTSATSSLETIATSLKEGAARVADHLLQQASLKSELKSSAEEAERAGFSDFAAIFHELAAKIGSSTSNAGKESSSGRKRGRPAKATDDQSAPA